MTSFRCITGNMLRWHLQLFLIINFVQRPTKRNLEWTAGILFKKDNFGEQVKVNHFTRSKSSVRAAFMWIQLWIERSLHVRNKFPETLPSNCYWPICCVMEWKGFEIRMQLITAKAWKGRQKIFQSPQTINSENFRMMVFSVFFFFFFINAIFSVDLSNYGLQF